MAVAAFDKLKSKKLKKSLAETGDGFHGPRMTWNDTFCALFERCVFAYKQGDFSYETGYSADELEFLASIGYKKREFFDFIEDFVDEGVPSMSTALLVAAVRRDYFLVEQGGKASEKAIVMDDLPSFGEDFEGIPYLPRILKKARAKLKGELDPDIMFGCGGDRNFLSKNGDIPPADFLRHVWAAGTDDSKVAEWVKNHLRFNREYTRVGSRYFLTTDFGDRHR